MDELKMIPVAQIRDNVVALRGVNRKTEKFQNLLDDIRQKGVLSAILVRPRKDEKGVDFYEVVNGLQRTTCAREVGLEFIPALIKDLDEVALLEAQIATNLQTIETTPIEYTKGMIRLLALNPSWTLTDLSKKINKSVSWITDRLGLLDLAEPIQVLVNEGKINLVNAYAMADLPLEEQKDWLERATTQGGAEFIPAVRARIKDIRDSARKGTAPGEAEYKPVAHLRKSADIQDERVTGNFFNSVQAKIKNKKEAFELALAWVLHMDEDSIEAGKAKFAAEKAAQKAATEKRKAERLAQKAKEAEAAAAQMESK